MKIRHEKVNLPSELNFIENMDFVDELSKKFKDINFITVSIPIGIYDGVVYECKSVKKLVLDSIEDFSFDVVEVFKSGVESLIEDLISADPDVETFILYMATLTTFIDSADDFTMKAGITLRYATL